MCRLFLLAGVMINAVVADLNTVQRGESIGEEIVYETDHASEHMNANI